MPRAIDLITAQPWAIQPDSLETMLAIAGRTNASPEAVAAQLGRPLDNTRHVTLRDGTAIIPITGPIFRRANLFTEVSGATSVEVLAQDLAAAAADPAVDRILLEIDSPGGQATGILELAGQIRAIHRRSKPVVAYVDGLAASAAYWLASAAGEIVASPAALLGSIGVVGTYRAEKDAPIKIISSVSPLKQATPDTEAGRAEMQRVIDELAALFVADVASYRRTTTDRVISDFGRGSVLVGQAAVAAGMADRLGSFESLFVPPASAGPGPSTHIEVHTMPDTQLAETPAITEADLAAATALGQEAGEQAERARVGAIIVAYEQATGLSLGMAAVAISKGFSAEAASAIFAAAHMSAKGDAAGYRAAWLADGAHDLPAADTATGEPDARDIDGDDASGLPRDWQSDANLRAEFGGDVDRYRAFTSAMAAGRVKILREGRRASS